MLKNSYIYIGRTVTAVVIESGQNAEFQKLPPLSNRGVTG